MVRGQRLLTEGAQRALAATDPRRAAADLRRASDLMAELARTRPQAPMTPLNRPIGPNRRYAMARADLAELKVAAKAHGATVNDAILAVPGPQQPFWLNGQRLLEAYPAVPLNPSNQGLTIGVLSYDGGVHFGLLADRDLDPPLGAMRQALDDAMNGRFAPPERG
jgi:hypothetical protein